MTTSSRSVRFGSDRPGPGPLAFVLLPFGFLSLVALPRLGYLFQEFHTLLQQLSLGLVRTSPGPVDLLTLWPVGELHRLCLDLAIPFQSPVDTFSSVP